MYCRNCGTRLEGDPAFCPNCGAAQRPTRPPERGPAWIWIILSFFLFPPLFPFLLVWKLVVSRLDRDTKYAVFGLILHSLWGWFIWKQSWTLGVKLALSAILLGLDELLYLGVFHVGETAGFFIFLLNVVVLYLVARSVHTAKPNLGALRAAIESKLDACHDLIAELEQTIHLDLLPVHAPTRQEYIRALEMRSQGMDLFQRATSEGELVEADVRITRALDSLRTVRRTVPD